MIIISIIIKILI